MAQTSNTNSLADDVRVINETSSTLEIGIEDEHIEVPKAMSVGDLSAYYGPVPDEFEIDRIAVWAERVRAYSWVGDEAVVELTYKREHRESDLEFELGWVGHYYDDADPDLGPGETVWTQDKNSI